jgi:hypothetical protein
VDDGTITVRANRPYKVVGRARVVDSDGRELEVTKPFCDATHRRIGFVADDILSTPGPSDRACRVGSCPRRVSRTTARASRPQAGAGSS